MNADSVAVAVGFLAMVGFLSVVCSIVFILIMVKERYQSTEHTEQPEEPRVIFNAFDEAEKRARQNGRERKTYS